MHERRLRPGALKLAALAAMAAAALGCRESLSPPEPAAIFGGLSPAHARVVLETDLGVIHCRIDPLRVPRAAALLIGLANGAARFRDARSGAVVQRRFYDGLPFFRRLAGELVQTGCALGDGSGQPGYRIPLETGPADRALLARPGSFFLAHYQPPPLRQDPDPPPPGHVIGSQWVIGLTPMTQNAGAVTVLGQCDDLDVVRRISLVPTGAPPPVLRSVRISW